MIWWDLSVGPSVRVSISQVFRTFLLHALTYWAETFVTIFLWTFYQVRVLSISVNFCWSCALLILEIHSFLHFSHACLTYWAEILHVHVSLLHCTTDQNRMSSIFINVIGVMPFWNLLYWKYTVFRTLFLHALTYWAEILHMPLLYCTTDQGRVSCCLCFCYTLVQISTSLVNLRQFLQELCPIFELKILERHSFLHFSPTCLGMLSWLLLTM